MRIPFFNNSKEVVQTVKKEVGAGQSFLSFASSYQSSLGLQRKTYLNEYKDWVYACVSSRAQDVAGGKYFARNSKGERIEESKSKLMTLLHNVNQNMTMRELFFGTQAHLDTDGNAFWFLARANKGQGEIKELYLLRPDRVEICISDTNPLDVKGYVYKGAMGAKIAFDPNQILHFRNFNPSGEHPMPHRGKSIVEAGLSAIETDNQARRWNYNFFKNSAKPDGFISKKEGVIDETEYARIKAELESKYQGSDNAHKTMILAGGLEWKEVTRLQKDMEFIEQRRFSRDEIMSVFKVPKTVLGIVEDVNRANAEASDYVFASRTTRPNMQSFVDTINEYIAGEFEETLDFVSPVPEDKIVKITEYEKGINKWLTINEIREEEGRPPVEGGDAIILAMPMGATGESLPLKKIVTGSIEEKIAEAEEIEIDDTIANLFKGINEDIEIIDDEVIEKKAITEDQRNSFIAGWKAVFDIHEKPLKTKLAKYFSAQEKEVIANLTKEMKGLEAKEYNLKAMEDVLFDEDYAIEQGIKLITPNIEKYIVESSKNAVTTMGIGQILDVNSELVQKFVSDRSKYFAESVTKTTVDKILQSLNEGTDAQENIISLTERVKTIFAEAKTSRAEMIARTEVSASGNFGAVETYKDAGVTKVEWYNLDPEHEACIANAGEIRNIGQEFPSGDETPPAHPNCRSTLIPVFE